MAKGKTLTNEQRSRIRQKIAEHADCEDKNLDQVIKDRFAGYEDAYLLAMAQFHHISLDQD